MADVEKLLAIMRALRSPHGGCPWDRAQTFETIVPHTLEEAYEVVDAIERGAFQALPAELGDLLFQVVFYCQIAAEEGLFTFDDVTRTLEIKLIERHPHVFAGETPADAVTLSHRWEALKAAERRSRDATRRSSALDDVPLALPSLTRARKMQRRAARVGFDWREVAPVFDKVREELAELTAAVGARDAAAADEEIGDLLFACVNLARHLDVDPEGALRRATQKFERRFRYVEQALAARGLEPGTAGLERMDELWAEAKELDL